MNIKERIKNFAEGWRKGRALRKARQLEALYITECDNGHYFNALRQSGICPHLPAGLDIYENEYKVYDGEIH